MKVSKRQEFNFLVEKRQWLRARKQLLAGGAPFRITAQFAPADDHRNLLIFTNEDETSDRHTIFPDQARNAVRNALMQIINAELTATETELRSLDVEIDTDVDP